jgi:hypothetical protein
MTIKRRTESVVVRMAKTLKRVLPISFLHREMKQKHGESGNPQLSSKKPHFHPTQVALEKVPYTLKSCSTTTERRKHSTPYCA